MKTITRRTALAASAALPLLPVSAFATPANATDAAWATYKAAKARYDEHESLYGAFEAAIPIGQRPKLDDFEERDEWKSLADQWEQERAGFPDNPFALDDDTLDALIAPMHAAEDAIISAQSATLTDLERKLAVVSGWNGFNEISAEFVDGMQADVRSLMGVAS